MRQKNNEKKIVILICATEVENLAMMIEVDRIKCNPSNNVSLTLA